MSDSDKWYKPRDLHTAAMRAYRIKATCPRCSRSEIFDGYALWWLFERKGWRQPLDEIGRRFVCMKCFTVTRRKVRPKIDIA